MHSVNVESQFEDYYLEQNRIKSLDKFSRDFPLDQIIESTPENITIGNSIINIPDLVMEESYSNNINIDAFTNSDEQVYYLNPSYKEYYKMGDDIYLNNFKLNNNEILTFNFSYNNHENLKVNFIVVEFSERKGIKARQYDDFKQVKISPHFDTTKIRVYINPVHEGFIYNINFNVYKDYMNIINDYTLPVDRDVIYNPDSRVNLYEDESKLTIEVPDVDKNYLYFSYAVENNSFTKVPEFSLIEIDPKKLYQIHTPFFLLDEVDFIPTIIEYNKNGKTNLIKLTDEAQFITFQKDTTAIRLSYRFSGMGKVVLMDVSIKEYQSESEYSDFEWASRYEIDTYMNTVESVKDLRISVIMDEFTYHSYKYEANLDRLTFDNWKNEIRSFMPHFIFIESSWHGNGGEWSKKVAYVTEEKHSSIKSLIAFAKSLDIPVVFWNKEDPVHYDHFIETAKLCDFIFTTDLDKVENYKQDCNHGNIDVLQFAAQPITHNPIKIQKKRIDGISFAGSYYTLREERSKDMNRLFRASIPFNLHIYDRNYEFTQKGERLNFLFPEEFRQYILGSLPFYEIDKAYKGYKFMININTVKFSPTMFARRVYEGLASGTPIISNYSLGMEKQFGDLIGFSEHEDELAAYLKKLNDNESDYNKTKQLGIRRVLSEHTYSQRLLQVSNKLGYELDNNESKVAFVSFINDMSDVEIIIDIFKNFDYQNKDLIIFVKENMQSYSMPNQKVTIISEENMVQYFMTFNQLVDAEFVAPIHKDDFYGSKYLKDLILATQYTSAHIIGKKNYYGSNDMEIKEINKDFEHQYTDNVNINSTIIKRDIFKNITIGESIKYLKGVYSISGLKYLGTTIYSNDKMNYIKNGNLLNIYTKSKVTI